MSDAQSIALFGGSGATGGYVIEQALSRGFRVNALVRKQSSLEKRGGLCMSIGDFNEPNTIDEVVAGSDAVICVIGPRPPYADIFCETATRAIIDSMQRQNIKRLICQTGAMIGDYDHNRRLLFKWMTKLVQRKYNTMSVDRAQQESAIVESNLDWTIVKPSRLTNDVSDRGIEVGPNLKMGLLSKVSRYRLAKFLLDQVSSTEFLRETVFIHQ